jgi:gas vesicle protein
MGIVIGILISGIVAYAGIVLSADKVGYKDTTVDKELDNLFEDVENGKKQIAQAITNKGVNTLSTDSWDTIASNINSILTRSNPNIRYNNETGYIQYLDNNGNWVDSYYYGYVITSDFDFLSDTIDSDWNLTGSTTVFEAGTEVSVSASASGVGISITSTKKILITSQTASLEVKFSGGGSYYPNNISISLNIVANGTTTTLASSSCKGGSSQYGWCGNNIDKTIDLSAYYGKTVYFYFSAGSSGTYRDITITKMILHLT